MIRLFLYPALAWTLAVERVKAWAHRRLNPVRGIRGESLRRPK